MFFGQLVYFSDDIRTFLQFFIKRKWLWTLGDSAKKKNEVLFSDNRTVLDKITIKLNLIVTASIFFLVCLYREFYTL